MLFPKTIFAAKNSIWRQWFHLLSEVLEVGRAILAAQFTGWWRNDKYNLQWDHVAAELIDCQHSADTGLFIVRDKHGADVDAAYTRVAIGCQRRGYYQNAKGAGDDMGRKLEGNMP